MKQVYKLVLVIAILAISLSACATQALPAQMSVVAAGEPAAQTRTIVVSGNGLVDIAPDIATINIGIHTENENAAIAVDENNGAVERLMETLKSAGIEQIDMQTSNFSIWQNQKYNYDGTTSGSTYMIDNTVIVTVRDLNTLGKTLDAAVQAGANNINSIQFNIADDSVPMQQARALAVENSMSIAKELATSSGVELGEIVGITYYSNTYPVSYYGARGMGGGGGAESAVPITTGQITLQATVEITYNIR